MVLHPSTQYLFVVVFDFMNKIVKFFLIFEEGIRSELRIESDGCEATIDDSVLVIGLVEFFNLVFGLFPVH